MARLDKRASLGRTGAQDIFGRVCLWSARKMGRTGAPDLFLTVRIWFAADHGKNPADFGRCPHRTRSVRTSPAKVALKTCGLSDGSRTGPRTIGLGPCSRTLSVWSGLPSATFARYFQLWRNLLGGLMLEFCK